jgi:maltooligosyltrehalose trehalohydrolase
MVFYLQNHDQVANTFRGERVHTKAAPALMRAMTAFQLLAPATPMLFQGQEFAASTPFAYFAEHDPAIAQSLRESRRDFLAQFASLAVPQVREQMPDPNAFETFAHCKLDWSESERHRAILELHRDLLRLRRCDPVLGARLMGGIDGAVLGSDAFVLRYFSDSGDDRLLLVNLGCLLHYDPAPEPLLAAPQGKKWAILWSSEDPRYGGCGTPPLEREDNWWLPGQSAVAMIPLDIAEVQDG